jgi:hypothetical protein
VIGVGQPLGEEIRPLGRQREERAHANQPVILTRKMRPRPGVPKIGATSPNDRALATPGINLLKRLRPNHYAALEGAFSPFSLS